MLRRQRLLALAVVALCSAICASARAEGFLQPGCGGIVGHIGLRPSEDLQHSRNLQQFIPLRPEPSPPPTAKQAPVPAPPALPTAQAPAAAAPAATVPAASLAAAQAPDSTPSGGISARSAFTFNITSNRTQLLQGAGTLGGTVAAGNQTFFQATVPTAVPTAQLAQLQSGQAVSVNQNPPGLLQQFDGNSITDTVATTSLPIQPPNPAVCVGNGYAVEVTNLALTVYSAQDGTRLGGPVSLPAFFGVPGPPTNGLSDPYCVYDAVDSQRFFVTLQYFTCLTLHPNCSANPVFNYLLIATSRTSNPLEGFLGPFYVDTSGLDPITLQPHPGFEACKPDGVASPGCFGDYPTVGLDENALWFGINLFTRIPLSAGTTFVGAMVYGVRKYDLVNGGRIYPPYAMYADWGNLPGFTMVPSLQQNGGNQPDNGTMFIVSSDLFTFSGLDDYEDGIPSLRTWAITHTERIAQGFPGGLLPDISQPVVLLTESLQYPTVEFYDSGAQTSVISQPSGRQIDARDERLRQVSLADGLLWTSLVTAVEVNGVAVDAAAYFVIRPNFNSSGGYAPSLIDQGYVTVCGNNIIDPSITATSDGLAVMTGSIVGSGYYLSPFYAIISLESGVGQVHVPHLSSSELVATAYEAGAPLRTGDYSSATLDEQGNAWLVAEYASTKTASAAAGGNTSDVIGLNWGTWIMQLNLTLATS